MTDPFIPGPTTLAEALIGLSFIVVAFIYLRIQKRKKLKAAKDIIKEPENENLRDIEPND